MIPDDFLALLRCPATGQSLAWADAELLAQANSRLLSAGGQGRAAWDASIQQEPVAAALVRADRKVLYPVRGDIPVLLVDAAVVL